MRIYYDLHIHSALSPCGDIDMTPNNIVNMAMLKGLDLISVTDHNSCKNVRATIKAAEGKINVIPGIEIETSDEVHVLCYFNDIDALEDMGQLIEENLPKIKNNTDIFGRQYIMDSEDNITGEVENLLVTATTLDIYYVANETRKRGGIFVPAHIDRTSYSIISNLGFLPPDLKVDALEITAEAVDKISDAYKDVLILTNSDAHYLENIAERERYMDIKENMTNYFYKFCTSFNKK